MYLAFKIIHLLGVVLFLGNIIVTAVWEMLAVSVTDWMVTLSGVVLILVGGYGMVATSGLDPFGQAQKGTPLPAVPRSGEQKR
jgi:hypothetical protein